jgi:hypothetical protein
MKKILLVFIYIISFGVKAQTAKNYLNLPNPLVINDTEYFLDWSKQTSSTLYLQQYLLKEEHIKDFTQMINVSYFDK